MRDLAAALPDFPWDALAPYAAKARAHEDGIVDLSVGTPVDPTPAVVQEALAGAAERPGLPADLRHAGPARGGRGLVRPAPRRPRARPGRRAARPSAARSWSRCLPTLLGLGPRRPGRPSRGRLPDVRRGRPPGRRRAGRGRRDGPARAAGRAGPAGLGQLAGQPDRAGARRRAPGQGRGLGPRSTARSWRATSATPSCAGTAEPVPSILDPDGVRRHPRGPARGLLAVQAVQPGRLPGRRSWPATWRWSAGCSRCASTPG